MQEQSESQAASTPPFDSTFMDARREALMILAMWAVCLVWSVACSHVLGRVDDQAALETVLGLPRWVFWGVCVPWTVAAAASIGFSLFIMRDADLGEATETAATSTETVASRESSDD